MCALHLLLALTYVRVCAGASRRDDLRGRAIVQNSSTMRVTKHSTCFLVATARLFRLMRDKGFS